MRGHDAATPFNNAAAGTSATFELKGGAYAFLYAGTGAGTVDLNILGPDGSTFVATDLTQITATTGYQTLTLPPGQYQVVIAGFTANYVKIVRIPGE